MRFQDWDVLLFPAGEQGGAHVPMKEFRTACYAEPQADPHYGTPLLTTFVPSLEAGAPFQISLHSWAETKAVLPTQPNGAKVRELWQVKVVIDGVCVSVDNFAVDATWPQIITSTASSATGQEAERLGFPKFSRAIMSQSNWDASDLMGRIRVELSSGYAQARPNRFEELHGVVNFAFQPAPLHILEQCGIAWPNVRVPGNPLHPTMNQHAFRPFANVASAAKHKKHASMSNVACAFPNFGTTTQSWTPSFDLLSQDPHGNYDASSRSTSAYSAVPYSAGPLLQGMSAVAGYHGSDAEKVRAQAIPLRLPSDQLQLILNALRPTGQDQPSANANTTMPPPPLPLHAMGSKTDVSQEQTAPPSVGANVLSFIDRRAESRYSDVSMHPGCSDFPTCTTEDAEGQLVHNPPGAPATVVRGRKEGSSPTKPRDFFSTILDTTATQTSSVPTATPAKGAGTGLLSSSPTVDSQGKKRTRSALKALHINDGSPEKKETTKPPRKVSKASVSSAKSDKENVPDPIEGQENMVLDD